MEKQVIIDTAFECWQAGMFSTTSLAPLARALGVTKAAIYRHFDDKESLVNAMEASFSAAYRANLDTHRSNLEQSDLEEGVRLWITGLIDLFRRNPGFLRYFISRIYHRRLETSRPLFRTLEEEAALLRKLFARRGYDEKASREIVKYLYTHLCGWGLFLEEDPSGGVPPIVDSFFTGFIESEGGIDYEAVEAELAAFGFDRSPATHRILEALLTVVAREGFAGTTISHIAEEAGYSKSSLYSFFKNKNAMLQSILRQHTEAFNRLYREHVGEELDMNERVYRLILLQFRYLEQNRAFLVALGWLLIGLAPVLITGPYLSVTRAIGMMPVLLLFPAIAIDAIWRFGLTTERAQNYGTAATLFVIIIYLMTGFQTAQSYFFDWNTHPEVRLQYETTLVTALNYADQNNLPNLTISSPTPDRYHSQPIALLTLTDHTQQPRWFNAQHSLLIPAAEQATLFFTGLAPLNPELERYWPEDTEPLTQLPMNETDIDKPITIYTVDGSAWQETIWDHIQPTDAPIEFGAAVNLIGYSLHNDNVSNGDTLTLATLWQIQQPISAETVLFTQLLTPDAPPLTQADQLDVPSNRWRQGDLFIQLHLFRCVDLVF